MSSLHTTAPIHPTAVRRAFGEDREHPATPGTTTGTFGNNVVVTLMDGRRIGLELDAHRFGEALNRSDLCRHNDEPLVMVNAHYGLIGLAFGPAEPPGRLAVGYGVSRLENGSAVEIPGTAPQPGWLLFRCAVSHGYRADPPSTLPIQRFLLPAGVPSLSDLLKLTKALTGRDPTPEERAAATAMYSQAVSRLTSSVTSIGTANTSTAPQVHQTRPELATAGAARAKKAARKASNQAVAVFMLPPEPEDNEGPDALVYGHSRNGLLFIQKSIARELLALDAARTWGALRKGAPQLYARAVELTEDDRDTGVNPPDRKRFKIESIGAFHDGDFPFFPEQLMIEFIPDSVQERFGKSVNTVHNGDMLVFNDGCETEVVAALRDLGFTCDEQQALIDKIA